MDEADVVWRGPLELGRNGELAKALEPLTRARETLRLTLDLRKMSFCSPTGLAMLRCALLHAKRGSLIGSGSRTLMPKDADVKRYVQRMDLLKGLSDHLPGEGFTRRSPAAFLPICDFAEHGEAEQAARGLTSATMANFDAAEQDAAFPLNIALNELADNVIFHSGTGVGVAAAQSWKKLGELEFTIVDVGVGIPASLRRNPDHMQLTDAQALRGSVDLLISGVEDRARGQGLWMVSQYVQRNGGSLEIRTQNQLLEQQGADRVVWQTESFWPGTAVAVRFHVDRPLDIRDVMEQHFPSDDDLGVEGL